MALKFKQSPIWLYMIWLLALEDKFDLDLRGEKLFSIILSIVTFIFAIKELYLIWFHSYKKLEIFPTHLGAFILQYCFRIFGTLCTPLFDIRYECGPARKFKASSTETTYDNRTLTCNWNQTWTLYDSLDPCVWVQCLQPPQVIYLPLRCHK